MGRSPVTSNQKSVLNKRRSFRIPDSQVSSECTLLEISMAGLDGKVRDCTGGRGRWYEEVANSAVEGVHSEECLVSQTLT